MCWGLFSFLEGSFGPYAVPSNFFSMYVMMISFVRMLSVHLSSFSFLRRGAPPSFLVPVHRLALLLACLRFGLVTYMLILL